MPIPRWLRGGLGAICVRALVFSTLSPLSPPLAAVLLLQLPLVTAQGDFCGAGTSAAWASRCSGTAGSGRVHIAGFFDNANDPAKQAHFNLAVDLINDHNDGFHDAVLADTTLETRVVSSNCNSITAVQGFWDAWRDWGEPLPSMARPEHQLS